MDDLTSPADRSQPPLPFARGSVELAFGTLPSDPVVLRASPVQLLLALVVMAIAGAVSDVAMLGGTLSLDAIARLTLLNLALIAPVFLLVRVLRFRATDPRQAALAMMMILWPVSALAAALIAVMGAGQLVAGAILVFAMIWVIVRISRITPYLPERDSG